MQVSNVPQQRTSDGEVEDKQTCLSSQATKDRGKGRLSRRSVGCVAVRKDLARPDCSCCCSVKRTTTGHGRVLLQAPET